MKINKETLRRKILNVIENSSEISFYEVRVFENGDVVRFKDNNNITYSVYIIDDIEIQISWFDNNDCIHFFASRNIKAYKNIEQMMFDFGITLYRLTNYAIEQF